MGRGSAQRAVLSLNPITPPVISPNIMSSPTPTSQTPPLKFLTLNFPPTRALRVTWPVAGNAIIDVLTPSAKASPTTITMPILRFSLNVLWLLCTKKSKTHVQVHPFFRLARVKDEIILQLSNSNGSRYHKVGSASLVSASAFIHQAQAENLC